MVISHDHYDHLDAPTVLRLASQHHPAFFVPLGLKAWFLPRQHEQPGLGGGGRDLGCCISDLHRRQLMGLGTSMALSGRINAARRARLDAPVAQVDRAAVS